MKGKKTTYQFASIDGQSVKFRPGQTILDAALKADIYIPTLCHLEMLESYGGCRLCVVEVKDMRAYPTACTTPLEAGMEVLTRSPALQKLRKEILEFTLSEHPFTCLVCKDKNECTDFMHSTRKVSTITGCNFCTSNGDCELQELVDYLELDDIKFPISYRGLPPVRDNPFYDLDYNLCILCGRCVRICNEERNSHVLAFVERGNSTIVGTAFGETQKAAGCEFCGACVDVCPTGSISEKIGKWRGKPDRSLRSTCAMCSIACEINVNTREGQLVQIGAEPGKRINPPQLCLRGKFLPAEIIDHPSRITTPFLRKENQWIEVSWEKAIDTIAMQLNKHKGKDFGVIASAQDTLEDNYQLQKFTRTVMRSNNLDLHDSYPLRQIPEMIHRLHVKQLTAGPDDLEKADTLVLIGSDASVSHPLLETRIRKAYRQGKQIINFTAYPNRSSTFCTHEHMYEAGQEENLLELLILALAKKAPAKDKIHLAEEVIHMLRASQNLVLITGDDVLRQSSSGNILASITRLNSILNSSGRSRIMLAGFEGNLYAGTLAGVHPDYLPGFKQLRSGDRGLSRRQMLSNTRKEGIKAFMVIGDLPDHPELNGHKFLVQCTMFKTGISEHADVLLPLSHFLENEGHILSLGNNIKRLNKAVTRPGQVKDLSSIISSLAKAMGDNSFSRNPAHIFREIKPLMQSSENDRENSKALRVKASPEKDKQSELSKNRNYPLDMQILHNHYRYRGFALSTLVPELDSISGEGTLELSESLMEELKLKAGDGIRIISEQGEMESTVRPAMGMGKQTACFIPNGQMPSGIRDRILEGNRVMKVKILKE